MKKRAWDMKLVMRQIAAVVFADPLAKFVCLVLAVLLWMYIVGSVEVQFEFRDVPVEFVDIDPDLAVSEDSQRSITLRVAGPKPAIGSLDPVDFKVLASLSGKREGEKWVVLSLENVNSPRGDVKVERIEPGSLRVFLERVEGRRLPVKVKLEGESPAGFMVKTHTRPAQVLVLGPASIFRRIDHVATDIVDISGRRANFSLEARVMKEFLSIRKLDPEKVEVFVEVEEHQTERVFEDIRVELQNPIPGRTVQIKPERVTIRVRGPQNVIDRIETSQLRVGVEFPTDKQFHLAAPRVLNLPERAEVVSCDPALVRVSIPGQ